MAGVEGRVALVTGGSQGIGRATAELLAARGARVMCVARDQEKLDEVGIEYAVADLGTPEGCAHAVAEAEDRLGPVEILVCNHGIGSAHEKVIWEQTPEVWSESMHVNLDGPFELSRLVLKGMTERRYGRVVYTSSTAGARRRARRERLQQFQEWIAGADALCGGGRRCIWYHIKRSLAGLGKNGNGRTIGPPRGEGPGHHIRSGMGRTCRHVSTGPSRDTTRSRRTDRVSCVGRIQRG